MSKKLVCLTLDTDNIDAEGNDTIWFGGRVSLFFKFFWSSLMTFYRAPWSVFSPNLITKKGAILAIILAEYFTGTICLPIADE